MQDTWHSARIRLWFAALAALLVATLPVEAAAQSSRPNIVLILADDIGYEGLGANGSTSYQTPHLDRLAAEGMRFERAHSTPRCTPTRVQIMTGKYNFRNYERFEHLNPRERTFANLLSEAGYATAVAGKWQLGGDEQAPHDFGFDEYLLWQLREKVGGRYKDPAVTRNGEPLDTLRGRYGPDVYAEFLEDFIERHRDEPFFVYYPMALVHAPFQPTPGHPDYGRLGTEEPDDTAYFAGMVGYMDRMVGRLVRKLDEVGVRENTLVLFVGDNGTHPRITSRMGDRVIEGGKRLTTNAGTHVPMVANWKGMIAPGQVQGELVDVVDFLPTLLEVAGVRHEPGFHTDGISFYPTLRTGASHPRPWIFTDYHPGKAGDDPSGRWTHDKRYKLYSDGRFFDYVQDPLERHPLLRKELSEEAGRAREALQAVMDRMEAEMRQVPAGRGWRVQEVRGRDGLEPTSSPGPITSPGRQEGRTKPNILIAISDDQSFPYASAYGERAVRTPNFDRIAREGVLFTNAFVASPGCSPSRAAFLTGRHTWQIEEAGTHASGFSQEYVVFPDLLERAGYFVGYTGKGWSPGDYKVSGRTRNPAGPGFNKREMEPPYPSEGGKTTIGDTDYAGNFEDFLKERPQGQPFYFWYGAREPHRAYAKGSGRKHGKDFGDANVPSFLPDTPEIRNDLLDYAVEIEWFDTHLGGMLKMLEEAGELDNTIVIVTSDNGMPFPRAKGNLYEYGIHVPLAIRWGAQAPGGRVVEDVVSLVDLTPTILEAAGVEHPGRYAMSGRSILNLLRSDRQGLVDPLRVAYAGRERHSSARYENLSYPMRAIRTQEYLYIRNFRPERWPAGAPRKYEEDGTLGPMHGAYHDIDPSPSKDFLAEHHEDPAIHRYLHLAVHRRPAEELYDIRKDPGCLHNLANDRAYDEVAARLRRKLLDYLTQTSDPRVVGGGDIFESYGRYNGEMRSFPAPEWVMPEGEQQPASEAHNLSDEPRRMR